MSHTWLSRWKPGETLLIVSLPLLIALSGCASNDAPPATEIEVQVVEGLIETEMGAEQLGGTPLTTLELMRSLIMGNRKKSHDFFSGWVGESCASMANPNFSGVEVLIKDADGTIVALGNVAEDPTIVPTDSTTRFVLGVTCQWTFAVADVPKTDGLYSVSVGKGQDMHFTAEELSKPLRLSLG